MITMEKKHELELRNTAKASKAEGIAEAEAKQERYDKLVGILIDAGRWDDLRRRKDEAYREQLYAEYGI